MDRQILFDRYESAVKEIRECKAKDNGGAAAELRFGRTYQDLVKAGLAMQIKDKYRSHNG
jgi:hypothetical protein